jgi:hypothetical protein
VLARFKQEAAAKWKIVEATDESPGTIKVTLDVTTFSGGKMKEQHTNIAVIKRKAGHYLFQHQKNGTEIVYGRNIAYVFGIAKPPEKDGWRIEDKLILKGTSEFDNIDPTIIEYLRPNSYGFIRMLGLVSELVHGPKFKAIRGESLDSGSVRIHFRTAVIVPNLEIPVKGWMEFDPNNAWVLQAAEYEYESGTVVRLKKHFANSATLYRPCDFWEVTSQNQARSAKFEVIDTGIAPDSDFYLSAFGLPDPIGASPPAASRWYLVFILLGVAALALGVYLRWRVRHRMRTSTVASLNSRAEE